MGNPKISSMWANSFTDSTSNGKFNTFSYLPKENTNFSNVVGINYKHE